MVITLIWNHSFQLYYQLSTLEVLIIFFPNDTGTEFEYNMVLCDGENIADFSTWLYIFIYHSI